ncbi:MFS transporter [Paenibacillus gansuensis]|uniref:MFS transporter n=1 Tax=Paenibacillus gansuensis TaxID=306542 RepID=A0ABW5PF10_9BACL
MFSLWNSLSAGVRRFAMTEALLGIGIGLFSLVLNYHLLSMHLNEKQIGEITSVSSIITGLISLPIGLLTDRWGAKNVMVCGIGLMGIGYFLFAGGDTLPLFYSAQIITSIGITLLVNSEIQLLFSYTASKQEEGTAYSVLFSVFTLFTGVGTLLGGWLPQWLDGEGRYVGTLVFAGALLLLLAVLRWALLPARPPVISSEKPSGAKLSIKLQMAAMYKGTSWKLAVFSLLVGTSLMLVTPYLNLMIKERNHWSESATSILLTINGLMLFAGSSAAPMLTRKLGVRRTFGLLFPLNLLAAVLLGLQLPVLLFSLLLPLRGGLFTLLNNLVESESMSAVPEADRNRFAGMRTVSRSIGSSAAVYVTGALLASGHTRLPFLLSALVLLAAYVYFYRTVLPVYEQTEQTSPLKSASD